ncbi:mdj1 protein precursor [Perkinsus olseni]|uniref:Mdj1 protein n=2 Tax=Perkinsus olseni TaxID=32597 RepID=A0A7J6PE77_PEROL|nr:mdj1 protein precursor [Perkinsus olseni]
MKKLWQLVQSAAPTTPPPNNKRSVEDEAWGGWKEEINRALKRRRTAEKSMPWKQLRDEVVTRYLKKEAAGKGCKREDVNDVMLSKIPEAYLSKSGNKVSLPSHEELAARHCVVHSDTFMSAVHNYYRTLNVAKDASKPAIRKAYLTLAKKYHPDVNKAPNADKLFQEIQEAYSVLSDDGQRHKIGYEMVGMNCAGKGRIPLDTMRGFERRRALRHRHHLLPGEASSTMEAGPGMTASLGGLGSSFGAERRMRLIIKLLTHPMAKSGRDERELGSMARRKVTRVLLKVESFPPVVSGSMIGGSGFHARMRAHDIEMEYRRQRMERERMAWGEQMKDQYAYDMHRMSPFRGWLFMVLPAFLIVSLFTPRRHREEGQADFATGDLLYDYEGRAYVRGPDGRNVRIPKYDHAPPSSMPPRQQEPSLSDGDLFSSAFGADVTPAENKTVFDRMNRGRARGSGPRERTISNTSSSKEVVESAGHNGGLGVQRQPSLEFLPNRGGVRHNSNAEEDLAAPVSSPGASLTDLEGFQEAEVAAAAAAAASSADVAGVKVIEVRASPLMLALAQLQRMFPELHSGVSWGADAWAVSDRILISSKGDVEKAVAKVLRYKSLSNP